MFKLVVIQNGKPLHYDGRRFSDSGKLICYDSSDAASKARTYLIRHNPRLKRLSVLIWNAGIKRKKNPLPLIALVSHSMTAKQLLNNPSELNAAADRLTGFSGEPPKSIIEVQNKDFKKGLVIGTLDEISYTTIRNGKRERYRHELKRKARPLLVASPDGRKIRIVGGRFQFTDAGFIDDL